MQRQHTPTLRPFRSLAIASLVAAASLPVPLASAQNALGDGRALDNNLSTRGRYNNARPSLRDELAFRNSVVTGNAPNGLSFRGDVGYRAPGEFTGQLGSNDLFSFRRDSLQSGIAGMGIRGTEALQYQLALTNKAKLIDTLKEVKMQENDVSFLAPEYVEIIENEAKIRKELKEQPGRLQFLHGIVTDLFLDKFKFKGQNGAAQAPQLQRLLQHDYSLPALLQFFDQK